MKTHRNLKEVRANLKNGEVRIFFGEGNWF